MLHLNCQLAAPQTVGTQHVHDEAHFLFRGSFWGCFNCHLCHPPLYRPLQTRALYFSSKDFVVSLPLQDFFFVISKRY